jgi:hypothetical protein
VNSAPQFFFVREVDGSLRLCIVYRGLNEVQSTDAYPLPHVDDTLDELKDANFRTHLDLAFGKFESGNMTFTRLHFRHLTVL